MTKQLCELQIIRLKRPASNFQMCRLFQCFVFSEQSAQVPVRQILLLISNDVRTSAAADTAFKSPLINKVKMQYAGVGSSTVF